MPDLGTDHPSPLMVVLEFEMSELGGSVFLISNQAV